MPKTQRGKAKFYKDGAYLFTAEYLINAKEASDGRPIVSGYFFLSEQDRKNENVLQWVQSQQYITMELDKTFQVDNINKDKLEVFPSTAGSFPFDGKCNFNPYMF
jgi:hypothetical protein